MTALEKLHIDGHDVVETDLSHIPHLNIGFNIGKYVLCNKCDHIFCVINNDVWFCVSRELIYGWRKYKKHTCKELIIQEIIK